MNPKHRAARSNRWASLRKDCQERLNHVALLPSRQNEGLSSRQGRFIGAAVRAEEVKYYISGVKMTCRGCW